MTKEEAEVKRIMAETWRARATTFANVMLGLLYLSFGIIISLLGWTIYKELL